MTAAAQIFGEPHQVSDTIHFAHCVINLGPHEFASNAMEVGRMAGGWLQSTPEKHKAAW
jgi:hypothetical protein